jgi:flavorubredoxin
VKATIVYESMYGNTRSIAEAIAQGLASAAEAHAVSVTDVRNSDMAGVDLLVVGGPTYIHGMSRKVSREAALKDAREHPERGLEVDPSSAGTGLREWFDAMETRSGKAAAFDTRLDKAELLTGHASKKIARKLEQHGFDLVAGHPSFLVDKDNHLLPGELKRARQWGTELASALSRDD